MAFIKVDQQFLLELLSSLPLEESERKLPKEDEDASEVEQEIDVKEEG
jgi:hypothetical protein